MVLPYYIWNAPNGTKFISDLSANKVYAVDNVFKSLAGTGSSGYNGDDFAATLADLYCPTGIWGDSMMQSLYIADSCNSRIRRIDLRTSMISTYAGTGVDGSSGDEGPATSATVSYPEGVWGIDGWVYFTDSSSCVIRGIDSERKIHRIGGNYYSCGYNGEGSALEILFNKPRGLYIDSAGLMYITDSKNNRVRLLQLATGKVTTIIGTGISGYVGDGSLAVNASINSPRNVLVDSNANIYLSDTGNHVVRIVSNRGIIATLPGQDASQTDLSQASSDDDFNRPYLLYAPIGLTLQPSGELYVVDSKRFVVVLVSVPPPVQSPTLAPTIASTISLASSPVYKPKSSFVFTAWDNITGQGYVWGGGSSGANKTVLNQLQNVLSIISSENAFVAVKRDGSLLAWGSKSEVEGWWLYRRSGTVAMHATEQAFAGITAVGGVFAFGVAAYGGEIPAEYEAYLSSGVKGVAATAGAFAVWKEDGSVFAWGNAIVGGGMSSLKNSNLQNVQEVFANRGAFAALRTDGRVVSWGSCAYGGCAPLYSNVVHVFATKTVFIGQKSNGEYVTWGNRLFGGNSTAVSSKLRSLQYLSFTGGAVAAVMQNGKVVAWGDSRFGGNNGAVANSLNEVVGLVGNDRAFAALTASGRVIVWGDKEYGGEIDDGYLAESLARDVTNVYATQGAFAALRTDGRVVTW
eukprot:CAMPEP_0173146854 /NCGR_PEP_ID=MMETSP1105-20130129/8738_1 /TAXON_ID=2985 /ORGANISM="Ochromonas sp., Strain BG-1" /LENGTH=688 /DNA_ID=CAMNT_0014061129 /DNA_START=738 /DNA_END=2801 /DNA_ORIENTATION=-